MRKHLPRLALALKLVVTLGLLGYLLGKVPIAPVIAQLRAMAPAAAGAGELLLLAQLGMLGLRWQLVNRIVGARTTLRQVLRLTAIGHFFNQVLPSGFAGDAARGWLASREGVALGPVVRAIVCDRVVGLLVLIVMCPLTVLALPDVAAGPLPGANAFRLAALACLAGLAVLFLGGEAMADALTRHRATATLGQLMRDQHRVFSSGVPSALVVALAAAVQFVNVAVVWLCAVGMGHPIDVGAAFVIVPAIMLISMAPVSLAGWGVREGATVVGLGLLGIAAADALAVSVAFGLLQVVLSLPGALLLWAGRSTAR